MSRSDRTLLATLHVNPIGESEFIDDGEEFLYIDMPASRGRYVRLRLDREGIDHLERQIVAWRRMHPEPLPPVDGSPPGASHAPAGAAVPLGEE